MSRSPARVTDEVITKLEELAQKAKESEFDAANILEQRQKVIGLKDEMLYECLGIGDKRKTPANPEHEF